MNTNHEEWLLLDPVEPTPTHDWEYWDRQKNEVLRNYGLLEIMEDSIMDISKIKEVLVEVDRFKKKANICLKRCKKEGFKNASYMKESAALKRASMDLTRLLAELRKPFECY